MFHQNNDRSLFHPQTRPVGEQNRWTKRIMDKVAGMPLFYLNIETVLEHWEVEQGLREMGTDEACAAGDEGSHYDLLRYDE